MPRMASIQRTFMGEVSMTEIVVKYQVLSVDQIKAGLVIEKIEQHGACFYVLSDAPGETPAGIASFNCDACGVQFGCEADHDPFCISCGSPDVSDEGNPFYSCEPLRQHNFSVPCSECDSKNSMSFYGAHALDNHLYCVSCGALLDYNFPDDLAEYMAVHFQAASFTGNTSAMKNRFNQPRSDSIKKANFILGQYFSGYEKR